MLHYINKTVFNSKCEALVNTINCLGVMGAGLALEFALRYPEVEKQYIIDCEQKKVKTGEVLTYKTKDILVVNFPTKYHWKYPSKIEWIKSGLEYMETHYKEWNVKSIAIPPLGCSNGGLNFDKQVRPLIEQILCNVDLDVYICLDPGYPEGKEKEMVDAFNKCDKELLCDELKIKGKAHIAIVEIGVLNRFYMLKELEGVGITSYKKIFNYFYNYKKTTSPIQLRLDI